VQQDIVDGTRWLLDHGIGDPERVGMVGASYGGYATLIALSFTPELFKVGTAAVPPGDFGRVVREYSGSAEEFVPGVPIGVSMRDLGVDPHDAGVAERLRAQSPIAHAANMRRALVVFAGGEDDRVPIRGVTHYAALLQSLGKDVSLFVDADSGHGLTDPRTREAWFYLQETILQRVLGGSQPEAPSAALRAHLKRNLRLTGRSLKEPAR
jgi:dipeptidyl aminopeptidase/acylaminoacyl peptidase